MQYMRTNLHLTACWIALCAAAAPALGQGSTAWVGDITRVQGQGTNTILGLGLVFGLNKSGDGDKFVQTQRALRQALSGLASPSDSLQDLEEARNVAIVEVQATIPEHGAREGERIDVRVSALAAKSLEGGTLMVTPLIYDDPAVQEIFAKAQGPIELTNPDAPNSGVIRGGARMETDVMHNYVASGRDLMADGIRNPWIDPQARYITLVLEDAHAGWATAAAVANAVDSTMRQVAKVERAALAVDSKSIVVLIPPFQYDDPVSYIRDVQRMPIFVESNEARVVINKTTQTIVVTGDVRVSPTVVSQAGLTVTVMNAPPGQPLPTPAFDTQVFVPVDNLAVRDAHMTDLLEALNRLKVPFEDRVAILESLKRSGSLHAKVIYEH